MRKLFHLRDWLHLTEAAEHLAVLFGEPVSVSDLLRLALDGQLTLSIHFVNNAYAKVGPMIAAAEAKQTEFNFEGAIYRFPKGLMVGEDWIIDLADEIRTLTGVWDLSMVGGEKLDVEQLYQTLTNGPSVSLVSLDGPLVMGRGLYCQLQSRFVRSEPTDEEKAKPWDHPDNFYPADGLPTDAVFVIRPESLNLLIQRVIEVEAAQLALLSPPVNSPPTNPPTPTPTGRKRSEHWPAWVAELAAYVHETGIPSGEGVAGQDTLIAAIEARLSERGLDAPSRTTVQETVRAVLLRLRQAGN